MRPSYELLASKCVYSMRVFPLVGQRTTSSRNSSISRLLLSYMYELVASNYLILANLRFDIVLLLVTMFRAFY